MDVDIYDGQVAKISQELSFYSATDETLSSDVILPPSDGNTLCNPSQNQLSSLLLRKWPNHKHAGEGSAGCPSRRKKQHNTYL